jgi:hypothetical protein
MAGKIGFACPTAGVHEYYAAAGLFIRDSMLVVIGTDGMNEVEGLDDRDRAVLTALFEDPAIISVMILDTKTMQVCFRADVPRHPDSRIVEIIYAHQRMLSGTEPDLTEQAFLVTRRPVPGYPEARLN